GRSSTSFEASGSPEASSVASVVAGADSEAVAWAEVDCSVAGDDPDSLSSAPEHPVRARAAAMGSVMTVVRDTMLQEYLDCSAQPKGTSEGQADESQAAGTIRRRPEPTGGRWRAVEHAAPGHGVVPEYRRAHQRPPAHRPAGHRRARSGRGVVVTAMNEAREYGVNAAMQMSGAMALCHIAEVNPPSH